MKKILLKILFIFFIFANLAARDIYVDNEKGLDSNKGSKQAPFRTIKRGIKELRPGDILYLTPNSKPYAESIILKNIKGTPDKPIIIDGRMSVLSGARALNPASWHRVEKSLYQRKVKKNFRSKRYFMLINGKPQRMGTFYKLRRPPFKGKGQLNPGEWTFDKANELLYLKTLNGKGLAGILEPVNNPHSGVMVRGNSSYLLIRNMTVENFINDGYNIHGRCRNIRFQNIAARNCGDDGISAHGACDITVKNFLSDGNPSAICHVDKAVASHENVLIINSAGVNLLLLNSKNSFKNLIIKSAGNLDFIKGKISIKNAFFEHPGPKKPLLNIKTADISFQNVYAKSYLIRDKTGTAELFSEQNKTKFNNNFIAETLKNFYTFLK